MTSKIIPALTLAAMLAASGAVVVSAQAAPTGDTVAEADRGQVERAGFFGFGGRGHHEGHGSRGGHGDILRGVLSQADADGDGAVTQAEIDALRASLVGAADASGEGDLSLEEFQAVYLQLVRPQMVDVFQDLDADGDGAVRPAELDARLSGVVERMDQDGDGALSSEDRPEGGRGRRG